MIFKRWLCLAILAWATAGWSQTSVTEVLTATDPMGTAAAPAAPEAPTASAPPPTTAALPTPKEVATAYYNAFAKNDGEAARPLIAGNPPSFQPIQFAGGMKVISFTMNNEVIDGDAALADGPAVFDTPGATNQGLIIAILVREPTGWKVDMQAMQDLQVGGVAATSVEQMHTQAMARFADYAKKHGGKGDITALPYATTPEALAKATPKEVAAAFFNAVAGKNWLRAEALATGRFSQLRPQVERDGSLGSITLGQETVQEKLALVPGTAPPAVNRFVLLIRESEGWKVDSVGEGDAGAGRAAFAAFIKEHPNLGALPPGEATEGSGGAAAASNTPTAPNPAVAETVFLLSIYKPILFLVVLGLWGFMAGRIDKDLVQYHFPREAWNGAILGAAAIAFLLWLLLPFFWLGFPVALLVIAGAITGYAFYRNPRVPESKQWTLSMNFLTETLEKRAQNQAQTAATIKVIGADGKATPVPQEDDPTGPAHAAVEAILDFAIPRRAERIEFVADAQQTSQAVTIDGVRYAQPNLEATLGLAAIDYLKSAARLDVADRRRKQSGRITFEDEANARHPFILSTMGSTKGLTLVLQRDHAGTPALPLNQLGLLEIQRQQLVAGLDQPGRIVLVSAPPHQGQTMTLYSLMGRHDPYTQSVIALEDHLEYELEGVTHDKLDAGADAAAVNQKLKASMLREAQVVLVGRVADQDTAKMMAEYAEATRFYTGLRGEDTLAALKMWVKTIGDTKTTARSINAILAQRLIRRLCKTCRIPYKPDPEVLRKLNLTPDKVGQFYKHSGQVMIKEEAQPCPDCLGLGFKGRTGMFEVMVFDDEARRLLAAGQLDPLRSHLRKLKMLWLQEAALMKVVEGETSIGEVTRVMGGK